MPNPSPGHGNSNDLSDITLEMEFVHSPKERCETKISKCGAGGHPLAIGFTTDVLSTLILKGSPPFHKLYVLCQVTF